MKDAAVDFFKIKVPGMSPSLPVSTIGFQALFWVCICKNRICFIQWTNENEMKLKNNINQQGK